MGQKTRARRGEWAGRREAIELVRLSSKPQRQIAEYLGISGVTLRNWVRQAERNEGKRPDGLSTDECEELHRPRRENQTLRMERGILNKAAAFRPGDRRAVGEIFSLIAAEKANFSVSVTCRALGVNRTSFHDWERRAPSDRALSDAWLTERIRETRRLGRHLWASKDPCRAADRAGSASGVSAWSG